MGSKSDGGRAAAMQAAADEMRRAREELAKVELPDKAKLENLIEQMEAPELVGLLQAEQLSEGDLERLGLDPRLLGVQEDLLAELQDKAKEGITPQQRAQMEEFQRMADARDQARQASIMQEMAQRGTLGSGQELAAKLASGQQAAMQDAAAGRDMAAQAEAGRMQALQQASNVAGGLMASKDAAAARAAEARDIRNKFNAMNRQNVASQNLASRQRLSEAGTATRNLRRGQLGALEQQDFENRYRKAGGQAQASQNMANMYMTQAQLAQPKAGLGGTIGSLAGAAGGAYLGSMTGSPDGALKGAAIGSNIGGATGRQFKDGGVRERFYGGGVMSSSNDTMEKATNLDFLNPPTPNYTPIDKKPQLYTPIKEKTPAVSSPSPAIPKRDIELDRLVAKGKTDKQMDSLVAKKKAEDDKWKAISKLSSSIASDIEQEQSPNELLKTEMSDLRKAQYADGGMNYERGGLGGIIDSGMDSFSGDDLPDRINDGEMVLNVKQQERLNQMLQELRALRRMHSGVEEGPRVDEQLDEGEFDLNEDQQEALMALLRGELDPEELPEEDILEDF